MRAALVCGVAWGLSLSVQAASLQDYSTAVELSHRITSVTAYSDRAKVGRTAKVPPAKGRHWYLLGALPDNLDRSSLKVSAKTGAVEQILLERSFEYVGLDPKVKKQIEELKAWYGELLEAEQRKVGILQQIAFLSGLDYQAPFSKDSSGNAYFGFEAPLNLVASAMSTTHSELNKGIEERNRQQEKIRVIREKIDFRLSQLQSVTDTSEQKWVTHLYVMLENPTANPDEIGVEYQLMGAKWYPVYDVRADLNRREGVAEITLVTAGLVEQHTGEDWEGVGLTLSTVDPVPLFLPKLDRWVLSEVRTEKPEAKGYLSRSSEPSDDSASLDSEEIEAEEFGGSEDSSRVMNAPMMKPRREAAPPKAMDSRGGSGVAQSEKKSMAALESSVQGKANLSFGNGGTNSMSTYPLAALDSVYPELGNLERQVASLEGAVGKREFVSIEGGMGAPTATQYSDDRLPAVQAAGRKLELAAPFPIDLGNDEEALKIPLTTQNLKGQLSYFAIPKRDERVYLRAKTTNTTVHPILGGAAQVFMQGDLVSKTELQTIHEGSHFDVDLGVDRNIETKRIVHKKSQESGFISKQHATDVEVEILVTNHHPFPIQFELRDQYPLSPKKEIEVAMTGASPEPVNQKDGDLLWRTAIGAKKKQKFKFTYRVTHPEDYLISDLN